HPHAWAGGADELPPPPAYPRPRLPAHRRQPVVPPPALAGALHPAPGDEALVLEAAQDGVERSDPESQLAARRARARFACRSRSRGAAVLRGATARAFPCCPS